MTDNEKSPFEVALREQSALGEVEKSRAIAEAQAAMVMAKRFPRDHVAAVDKIMNACTRAGLAEAALYTYSRGGTEITGPSIRLAEALAQNWGNIHFGTRELEQRQGESTMEAYAWDLETNTKEVKAFQVRHERHAKHGITKLTDPRDIYEMTANLGARRLRACILGIIPGDVIEAAQNQCEVTLKSKAEVTPDSLAKLLEAFGQQGVTKQQIEKRIQRHLDSMLPAQLVSLRKIFNSLKDGMSKPADWFEEAEKIPDFDKKNEKPKRGPGRPKKEESELPLTASEIILRDNLKKHGVDEKVFCRALSLIGFEVGDVDSLDELNQTTLVQLVNLDMDKMLDEMEAQANK